MDDYILYILMRNDMDSLNPGKAMAQSAHASNQFVKEFGKYQEVFEWQKQGNGYGITIVLSCNGLQIQLITGIAKRCNIFSGTVIDETYPLRDGSVTHLLPVETCGYIFITKEDIVTQSLLNDLELYP